MRIKTDSKDIHVPNWILVFGLLVVDNVVANVCKTKTNKEILKHGNNEGGSQ